MHTLIFELHVYYALLMTINYFSFFLGFHIFMSMSNLIEINIHFMDMKRHMLICFFISMLVDRKNHWSSYKLEIVVMKVNRKKNNYDVVRLENEVVISKVSLEWSTDDHTTRMVK